MNARTDLDPQATIRFGLQTAPDLQKIEVQDVSRE